MVLTVNCHEGWLVDNQYLLGMMEHLLWVYLSVERGPQLQKAWGEV